VFSSSIAAGFFAGLRDWTPLLLNVVSGIALLAVSDALLRKMRCPGSGRTLTLIALILATPLPHLGLLGMEHTLFAALVMLAANVRAFFGADGMRRRSPGGSFAVRLNAD
jgi:hypothetical protein